MEFYVERLKNFSPELTAQLNKLLKQLNETAISLDDKDIADMIASPSNRLFVARRSDNKEAIGMLTLVVFRAAFAKKGLLEDLVVDDVYRGKGIGTKLILAAIDEARGEKVVNIDFTSHPKRVSANRLYQHLGFVKRDTNMYRIEL